MKAQTIARKELTTPVTGDHLHDINEISEVTPRYTSMKSEVDKIKDPVSFRSLKTFYHIG